MDNIAEKLKLLWRKYRVFLERGASSTPVAGDEVRCLNCGHTFRGNYCPRCGQNKKVDKNETSVVKTFRDGYPQLASDYFRTMLHLIFRPGYMIRDYFRGRRVIYRTPVNTLVITLSIIAVWSSVFYLCQQSSAPAAQSVSVANDNGEKVSSRESLVIDVLNQVQDISSHMNKTPEKHVDFNNHPQWRMAIKLLSSDGVFMLLISLPITCWASSLVMRRRRFDGRRLTPLEHYIIFAYLDSLFCLLAMPTVVMLGYLAWAYRGIFGTSWKLSVIDSVATFALTVIASITLFMALSLALLLVI